MKTGSNDTSFYLTTDWLPFKHVNTFYIIYQLFNVLIYLRYLVTLTQNCRNSYFVNITGGTLF